MTQHIVKKVSDLDYQTPAEFVGHSTGYSGDNVVDEARGAVQMGFRVARLEPGARSTATSTPGRSRCMSLPGH